MMRLLDRLFNRKKLKEEKKPETPKKNVVKKKPVTHFTGMKAVAYAGSRGKPSKIGIFIDGMRLGDFRRFDNRGKSDDVLAEDIRQSVLAFQAEDALKKGDMQRFEELKKRAIHEKNLREDPEFKALVLEAYIKAKITKVVCSDPKYWPVFDEVMEKAKEMQPNVAQKLSDVRGKLHKDGEQEESSVSTQPPAQKTELSAEQIASTKDGYRKSY